MGKVANAYQLNNVCLISKMSNDVKKDNIQELEFKI